MAQSKRVNGIGSVYQRADGRWVASAIVDGKRLSRYRKSRKDAELALAELLVGEPAEAPAPVPAPVPVTALVRAPEPAVTPRLATPTLSAWVENWLAMNTGRLRAKTLSDYRKALKPVLALAGHEAVGSFTPLSLVNLLVQLQNQGRGSRSIQQTYTVLRTCLESAVNLGILDSNPMARIPKPHWHPQEKRYWTVQETQRFLDTAMASDRKWSPLCAFLVLTGMRMSEALGLTWDDVDLARGRVRVSEVQVYVDTKFVAGAPKTKAGRRWIVLDKAGLQVLTKIPAGQVESGLFRTTGNQPPSPSAINRELRRLCAEADVPTLSPHGLRHVQAMLALKATRDPYLVQRRLGHSHVSVTLGIYGYSVDQDDTVSQALDQLLSAD